MIRIFPALRLIIPGSTARTRRGIGSTSAANVCCHSASVTSAAGVVLGETALGFVGLGPPDGVSLGSLLEQGTLAMLRAPHVLAVGVVAVMLVSGTLQLASEGVRRWVQVE